MFQDFFMNITIIISFIFVTAQIFKNSTNILCSYKRVIFLGSVNGFLGIVLMWCYISITPDIAVDLSYLPVIFASFYGGLRCSILSSFIIGLAGTAFLGINGPSMAAAGLLLFFVLACSAITKLQQPTWVKWVHVLIGSFVMAYVVLIIRGEKGIYLRMLYQSLLTSGAAFITYYCMEYVKHSTALYIQLREQSTRDFLTGLTNTRYFHSMLQYYIRKVELYYQKLSVIMIDIDLFKYINDTYGHAAGDAVLKQLSALLISTCSPIDVVSRVGGEEFAVLAYDYPHSEVLNIAESIRSAVQKHTFVLPCGSNIDITISIGVATYPETITDTSMIFEQADSALYEAKKSGRNIVCWTHAHQYY